MDKKQLERIGIRAGTIGKDAEEAFAECPPLPKDFEDTCRAWARNSYLIFSNKRKMGVCTRCGKKVAKQYFPIKGYKANWLLGTPAYEEEEDFYKQDYYAVLAGMDPEAAARDPRGIAKAKSAHNGKCICHCCGEALIAKEAARGRQKLEEQIIVTIPLERNGCIYILNLWVDIEFVPEGKPDLWVFLKSMFVFGPAREEYYKRELWTGACRAIKCAPARIQIPYATSFHWNGAKRNRTCLYSKEFASIFEGTIWKYSRLYNIFAFLETYGDFSWDYADIFLKYLYHFMKYPAIERLEQSGFIQMVIYKIMGWRAEGQAALNWKKNTLKEIFGLNMDEIRAFRLSQVDSGVSFDDIPGTGDVLVYKRLKAIWSSISPEYAIAIQHSDRLPAYEIVGKHKTGELEAYGLSATRFLEYSMRQYERYRNWNNREPVVSIALYLDYLKECKDLNLDLSSRDILFPKRFLTAHALRSKQWRENKEQIEKERLAQMSSDIAKVGALFAKSMTDPVAKTVTPYCDGNFLIRPAQTTEEIMGEGRLLHHCIASYIDNMAAGKYAIFFVRQVAEPDVPFCTLHVMPDGDIPQISMKYNHRPTEDVRAFVDKWQKAVKPGLPKARPKKKPAACNVDQEAAAPVLRDIGREIAAEVAVPALAANVLAPAAV